MNYKLSKAARQVLIDIHQYGVIRVGEYQADRYLLSLFEHLKMIGTNPFLFPSVEHIRKG